MWHCDRLERQTDGSVVATFIEPVPVGAKPGTTARIARRRYLGGQDTTPTPGLWYRLNEATAEFEPFSQAPAPPRPAPQTAPPSPGEAVGELSSGLRSAGES
ncbi:MAG TPA: hypothetical protein VH137_09575 [Gemmatimonadales bacterium]|jgi:hypothetical protein|nr:hypothetical protein [Gemmatimonadales bacterium]